MAELAPSLLAADFTKLGEQIEILNEEGIKYLHLDVMDGNFVPNISYGPSIIKQLRPLTDMIFDVHLMVQDPERYIETFVDAGSDTIMFHVEATKHPHRVLQQIKNQGLKAGITLNPGTPLEALDYLMDDLDQILLMSVNPGFGGQSFIFQILDKIKKCRQLIDNSGHDILLEVDGGIKTQNVESIVDAGCDLVVSGSDVFGPDIRKKIHQYYNLI